MKKLFKISTIRKNGLPIIKIKPTLLNILITTNIIYVLVALILIKYHLFTKYDILLVILFIIQMLATIVFKTRKN